MKDAILAAAHLCPMTCISERVCASCAFRAETSRMAIGPFKHLTEAQRATSLLRALSAVDASQPVWVFGYGSLIWRPAFDVSEQHAATLRGFRRTFSIYTVEARGTPRTPGLGLGLTPGEQCSGVVLRMTESNRTAGLQTLWQREMLTGIYRPAWVEVSTRAGNLHALTFVVDTSHPQYAGDLPLREQSEMIRSAVGRLGSCRDYLAHTVAALQEAGISDEQLSELLTAVDSPSSHD